MKDGSKEYTTSLHTLPKSMPAFFWHFIKQQWKWFLFLQLFYFGWAIDHTVWPYVISLLVDTISNFTGDRANMWPAVAKPLIFGAILWVFVETTYRAAGFTGAKVFPRLEAAVRMSMFDYVQRHSYTYFGSNFAGSLSNKISDMTTSMTHVLQLVMQLFFPVILAVTMAIIFFALLSPLFALILGLWISVHMGICMLCAKTCSNYSNIHAESRSSLAGKIVDSFTNHLNVRLFSRHKFERDYLYRAQQDEQKKHQKSLFKIEKMKIALGIASFLGPGVAVNWLMLYSWQHEMITTGEVVFIFNTSWNITMMVWLAGLEIPNFFKEVGVCKQALSIIRDPHDVIDVPMLTQLKVKKGEIIFENVDFHYTPNHIVFKNKNIKIDAGTKVGLVGSSGSGKTTFVHLILRYFDVEDGRILIDGQDIASVTQESLRGSIAMIPQDASLFHRTLMENIRYGRPDATDEEVIEAAKQASCHDFILKLPEGYHTLAGERGIKLSGGQRQRIAIARAILKNAQILILDEATSALDSVTEKDVQDTMDPLMQGRTTIVIAHRLSTLSGMDRILVFKDGIVQEDGTHDELIAAEGHYAMMWNMQAGGFLPESWE